MKTKLTFLITLFSILSLFAQKYESGYYIDNLGNKIDGFIKDVDWKNNPTSFDFKENIDAESTNVIIDACKEFSINNSVTYTRALVKIEQSSSTLLTLGYSGDPDFTEKTLFLKNLVTGESSLYSYSNRGIEKYFYKTKEGVIEQLLFIKYYNNSKNILVNEGYKRQLWKDVKCENTTMTEINNLQFNLNKLKEYFIKVNSCNGSEIKNVSIDKKTIISFKGVGIINSDEIKFERSTLNSGFDKKINFGFGAEIEFLMPYNNYSWGVFIEPTFSKLKSNQTIRYGFNNSLSQNAEINTNVIQVPIGVRYYFKTSNSSSLYLSTGMNITNLKKDTFIDLESSSDLYLASFSYTFFGSLGFKYKQIVAELRFNTVNKISDSDSYDINFNRSSLVLKYEIFRK